MISVKTDNLFSPEIRRILSIASILSGFICLLLTRYSQHDSLKILWVYAMYACFMFLIVLYKNSINKYETAIFCFLCVQLLAVVPHPNNISTLTGTSYLLSYRYGISSRSFIATIVDFLTGGGFISWNFVWHFIFSSTVFVSFIISVCVGTTIQRAELYTKFFMILLSLLYLSCFTAPAAYFVQANFGRIEIFAIPILILITQIINKPVIRLLIPILAVCVMAIHFILMFFYIPFILILLLYGILVKTGDCKESVQGCSFVPLLAFTVIILIAVFLCYLLFGRSTFVFENAGSFYEYLSARTNLNFSEGFLHMTMFAELKDHLAGWKERVNLKFQGNISILINIPLVCLFIAFWLKCFFNTKEKAAKIFFLMPALIVLYHAPAFFLFLDFGRWMIMVLNVQFMLLFYLVFVKDRTVLSVIQICGETIIPFVKRNIFFAALLCFLTAFLGPVDEISPSVRIVRVFNFFIGLTGF